MHLGPETDVFFRQRTYPSKTAIAEEEEEREVEERLEEVDTSVQLEADSVLKEVETKEKESKEIIPQLGQLRMQLSRVEEDRGREVSQRNAIMSFLSSQFP